MAARLAVLTIVGALPLAACSSGGSTKSTGPTTTVLLEVNPLERGHGFVQLSGQRYDFDGVKCATGTLASDPEASQRIFGAYANFTREGSLFAVSLTRYEDHSVGAVPTITDTALVRMQGEGEVRGLKAQRAQIIGKGGWGDVFDPTETTPLISHTNDRYDVSGTFGPPDGTGGPKDLVEGSIAVRCPATSATTTSTIPGATPTTVAPSAPTVPATAGATTAPGVPSP